MIVHRRLFLQAIIINLVLAMTACRPNADDISKEKIMQKYPMKTFAIGRFMIDLPVVDKDISISQRILGVEIYWIPATEEQYQKILADRVKVLKGSNAATQRLVSDEFGSIPKSRIIMFEEDREKDGYIGYEAYHYSEEIEGYFLLKELAAREKIEIVKLWVNKILKIIQPCFIHPGMKNKATFFDHGFISGIDPLLHDNISISAIYENITIRFSTQVIQRINDGPSLLQRAEALNGFPEVKVLRKLKREVAGLNGAELSFMDAPHDEYIPYSLQWEYQGQANSIAAPRMAASIDSKGPISIPEEELLGLWDVILESIRLRPGAV